MVIESGIIIFLGLLFLFVKLPKHWVLVALGYSVWVDVGASVLAYALHWGTFTGTMAAAVAGLMTSAMTSMGKRAIGYTVYSIERGVWEYHRGMVNKYPNL